jgi:putative lipoic acid-binding regulatory protein
MRRPPALPEVHRLRAMPPASAAPRPLQPCPSRQTVVPLFLLCNVVRLQRSSVSIRSTALVSRARPALRVGRVSEVGLAGPAPLRRCILRSNLNQRIQGDDTDADVGEEVVLAEGMSNGSNVLEDGVGGFEDSLKSEIDPVSRSASTVGGRDRSMALGDDDDDVIDEEVGGDDLDADELDDEDDDDADEDDEDEDDDDGDDDEDEDLNGYDISNVDDPVPSRARRVGYDEGEIDLAGMDAGAGRIPARAGRMNTAVGGVDLDEEDEILDYDETPGDILELSSVPVDLEDGEIELEPEDLLEDEQLGKEDDEDDEELFKEAASVLAGGSLFGLGLDGAMRGDSSEVTGFALGVDVDESDEPDRDEGDGANAGPDDFKREASGKTALTDIASTIDETDEDELPPGLAPRDMKRRSSPLPDFEELLEQGRTQMMPVELDDMDDFADGMLDEDDGPGSGPKNLDAYLDRDEDDDEEGSFGVTSDTAFGRVWELNDDMYVTITEPGSAYTYEIDESDEEDQDSATMRRGKDAGWSGTLKADARQELPTGSREWIARKAYDLMTESTYNELFKWTRLHDSPPGPIALLFPKEAPPPVKFGRTPLTSRPPSPEGSMRMPDGVDDEDLPRDERLFDDQNSVGPVDVLEVDAKKNGADMGLEAIERAVNFPCTYKFKVVGNGPDFARSLAEDVERVIGRRVPDEAFEFEPAGRYQRIILNVVVENARQVTELYDTIRVNPQVKFSYG